MSIYKYLDKEKEKSPISLEDLDVLKLTPVEKYGIFFLKRDDKFQPFPDLPINGGKIRQSLLLFHDNYHIIKNHYNNTVGTASSVHSPQGIIVTRSAKEFGFKTILGFSGTDREKSIKTHKFLQLAHHLGADIRMYKGGFNSIILNQLRKDVRNLYLVKFGINLANNPGAILLSTSYQVQNIPDNLDFLVIPVGSGISMAGILIGLMKYKKNVKRVIGVQIAGYDRRDEIDGILNWYRAIHDNRIAYSNVRYEFFKSKKYKYADKCDFSFVFNPEKLDPHYEAKSFKYFVDNIESEYKKTLFWIVGNTIPIRNYRFKYP